MNKNIHGRAAKPHENSICAEENPQNDPCKGKVPKKEIRLAHFQITKSCNLRCPFCGQWGSRGFFADANGSALSLDEWLDAARQLAMLSPRPKLMLWGGEPLVCPFFDELAAALYDMGFTLQAVTNGVLIDRHIDVIRRYFERVYVSVDGLREVHDAIRGAGVFERVDKNIRMLDPSRVTIMTVATKELDPYALAEYFADYTIYLQTMIALSAEEIAEYKSWLRGCFGTEASEIDAWLGCGFKGSYENLPKNVVLMPHGSEARNEYCLSPFKHIHISWNGNLLYCTDFYDFSAGNIRDASIADIFGNEKSERFRREIMNGKCVTCRHCSWRNNSTFD